ncbi:MAG: TerB family tellurite resistance protein [Bacteroidetes bacterium]|nr:TerB family tellurite resistance protein [Bacteroidota bacterium]
MINFQAKDWFFQYANHRKKNPLQLETMDVNTFGLDDQNFDRIPTYHNVVYGLLQRSGLIFGFPVRYPFEASFTSSLYSQKEIAKLTLLDIIIFSALLQNKNLSNPSLNYAEKIDFIKRRLLTYYFGFLQKDKNDKTVTIENLLLNRVSFRKSFFDFRKSGINSHLFWDLHFFLENNHRFSSDVNHRILFEYLQKRKKAMKVLTFKLIAAAIHSDGRVDKTEKLLQRQFKNAAKILDKEDKRELTKIFKNGIQLDDIELPELNWLARRYLLDTSLLAVYVDKMIEPEEELFLERLRQKLDLGAEELQESKANLAVFLYQYGHQLHYYKEKKKGIALLGQVVSGNIKKFSTATKLEYQETVDMAAIFGKALQHQLKIKPDSSMPDEEEIARAFSQLKDIPKFLPFFSLAFFPLPGVTETYILLAYTIEKMSGESVRLLPSQYSKMVKGEREKKKKKKTKKKDGS